MFALMGGDCKNVEVIGVCWW